MPAKQRRIALMGFRSVGKNVKSRVQRVLRWVGFVLDLFQMIHIYAGSVYCDGPINRAPLGHMQFYCQGALFPWPDKTCNQFPIQFFTISQRHHAKWFGRYITHISDHALTLKQTINCPLIPDSYPFLLPNSMLWSEISSHIGN